MNQSHQIVNRIWNSRKAIVWNVKLRHSYLMKILWNFFYETTFCSMFNLEIYAKRSKMQKRCIYSMFPNVIYVFEMIFTTFDIKIISKPWLTFWNTLQVIYGNRVPALHLLNIQVCFLHFPIQPNGFHWGWHLSIFRGNKISYYCRSYLRCPIPFEENCSVGIG